MTIWKNGIPYIVEGVEDLADLMDNELFEQVKEFIEDLIEESDKVARLESQVEDLDFEVEGLCSERDELENRVSKLEYELEEKSSVPEQVKEKLGDFIEAMGVENLNKDQEYYYRQLVEVIEE